MGAHSLALQQETGARGRPSRPPESERSNHLDGNNACTRRAHRASRLSQEPSVFTPSERNRLGCAEQSCRRDLREYLHRFSRIYRCVCDCGSLRTLGTTAASFCVNDPRDDADDDVVLTVPPGCVSA
ncbi:hypothetical protein MRX96_037743 [Rhipicephalus microplus]